MDILTILTSSIIAFIVARIQTKSSEKQLNKQLEAEVEKIKYQYELEQQRDDMNFLNKFKLEKLAELHEFISRKARYDVQLNILFEDLIRKNKGHINKSSPEIDDYIKQRDYLEKKEFEEKLHRKISLHMSFFSKIKKEWLNLNSLSFTVVYSYPSQILKLTEIKNPDYLHCKIPLEYNLNDYFKDIDRVQKGYMTIMGNIEKEIESVIIRLESNSKIKNK